MKISQWLSAKNLNQSDLAKIIGKSRVRAHRILKGAIPHEDEMQLIYSASEGKVTANDFYGIPKKHTPRLRKGDSGVNANMT